MQRPRGPDRILVHERNRKKPERVDRPRCGDSGTEGRESRSIMFGQSLHSNQVNPKGNKANYAFGYFLPLFSLNVLENLEVHL